jgi:hypothetical protein
MSAMLVKGRVERSAAMIRLVSTAATLAALLATPVAAQYPYPQQYPNPYPQPYPPAYPNPYPYQQPYGGNVLNDVINQLLGNRYTSSDRLAVSQCASAAMTQAARDYRVYNPYGQQYGQPYNYNYPYNAYPGMRVTAITDVERRSDGIRVRGELDTGMYGNRYPNQGIARPGDLTFRCTVDYRGVVTSVRVRPNSDYRRY